MAWKGSLRQITVKNKKMIFGNKDTIVIDAVIYSGINYSFVNICFWVNGYIIGDKELPVLLNLELLNLEDANKKKGLRQYKKFEGIQGEVICNFLKEIIWNYDEKDSSGHPLYTLN